MSTRRPLTRRTVRKHHCVHALCAAVRRRPIGNGPCDASPQMIQAMGVSLARWRRPVFNGFLTAGPPLMLLSFLIAIDDRVREQLTLRLAP